MLNPIDINLNNTRKTIYLYSIIIYLKPQMKFLNYLILKLQYKHLKANLYNG